MIDIIDRLKNITVFAPIKDDEELLRDIAKKCKRKVFSDGEYIINEGETGDEMFILARGGVRVEKSTLAKDRFTVVYLKDDMNVFFGELALMDNDVRSASVYAVGVVECYVLKKDDFENFCEEHPKIGYYITRGIAKWLSARLRKATLDNVHLIDALVNDGSDT